jgi:hypothetical protein
MQTEIEELEATIKHNEEGLTRMRNLLNLLKANAVPKSKADQKEKPPSLEGG